MDDCSYDEDNDTDHYAELSSAKVGNVWSDEEGSESTDVHDRREKTQCRAIRMAEVVLPCVHRLQPVEQAAIIPIRSSTEHEYRHHRIQLAEAWMLVPCHVRNIEPSDRLCATDKGICWDGVCLRSMLFETNTCISFFGVHIDGG